MTACMTAVSVSYGFLSYKRANGTFLDVMCSLLHAEKVKRVYAVIIGEICLYLSHRNNIISLL